MNINAKLCSLYIACVFIIIFGCVKYAPHSYYKLQVVAQSTNLGVVQVFVNNGSGSSIVGKDALWSIDNNLRKHNVELLGTNISRISIICSNPNNDIHFNCKLINAKIVDDAGQTIYYMDGVPSIKNKQIELLKRTMVLVKPTYMKVFISYCKYIFISLLCFLIIVLLSRNEPHKHIISVGFIGFFMYAIIVIGSTNTGMDAIENITVAKNMFTNLPYYSYVEYRGDVWPGILWLLNSTAKLFGVGFYYVYLLYGVVIFCIIFGVLIPNILKITKIKSFNILLLFLAVGYLYGKQFLIPLPDVTPFFLLLYGLYFIERYKGNLWSWFIASLFITIACLIRSNYIVAYILFLFYLCWDFFVIKNNKLISLFLVIACFLIGVVGLSLNARYVSKLPITITNQGLTQAILYQGMQIQKTSPFQIFDNKGLEILKNEKINEATQVTTAQYLRLLLKYPVDFYVMFATRLFNGLDVKGSQVYFWYQKHDSKLLFQFINYTFLFFGVLGLLKYVKGRNFNVLFLYAIMIVPSLSMVVSFVEPRYFIGMGLALISMGVLNIKYCAYKRFLVKLPWYFIFVSVCFILSAAIYNQSQGYFLF